MATHLAQTETSTVCWLCHQPLSGHFCSSCGKIQAAQPTDYFSFFSLPRKLNIDLPKLEREFYRLSRKLHPDLFARASAQEQEWSTEKTSQLNDAYRTLKDPIARTEYLLELEGVKLEEQSRNATDAARQTGAEKKQVVPPDLLEEVFELNMQLEEMRMNKQMGDDDPNIARDLRGAKQRFEQKFDELAAELQQYWDEWDALLPIDTMRQNRSQEHKLYGAQPPSAAREEFLQMERILSDSSTEQARIRVRDKMVDLLNRRSYIRNLVRDVNAALK